jgi:hypothetical protein
MKKIVIILLILVSGYAFCIDPIDFKIVSEFGIIPKGHLKQYEYDRDVWPGMSFYGDLYFETSFINNIIFAGIDTKVYIWKINDSHSFHPDYIHFMFTGGLRYRFAEIGFRHYCEHPIMVWFEDNNINQNWERWYEEIYIKLEFETN